MTGFASGYAVHGPLPAPRWVCTLAGTAADLPAPVAEAVGNLEGRRAGLEARRNRLYLTHRTRLLALATALAGNVHLDDLTTALAAAVGLTEADDRKGRRDAAKAAAAAILARTLLTTDGLAAAWQQANVTAYTAATVEGQAQAVATPTTGGPAAPSTVATIIPTLGGGLATADGWRTADLWTRQQLDGLAGDLADAAVTATDRAALTVAVGRALTDAVGVAYYLEDEMHRAAATGFAVYLNSTVATVTYLSVGDARVCPTCEGYAGASPWASDDVPVPPAHFACRCWLESAALTPTALDALV